MYNEGTIIALSSPPGSGAISIIRLSGKDNKDLIIIAVLMQAMLNSQRVLDYPNFTFDMSPSYSGGVAPHRWVGSSAFRGRLWISSGS